MLIAHIEHTTKHHEHVVEARQATFASTKQASMTKLKRLAFVNTVLVAISKSFVEVLAHGTPYYRKSDATLARMYDGDRHRVVPNSASTWKLLMSARMNPRFLRPSKPTPISIRASRVIYIEGAS